MSTGSCTVHETIFSNGGKFRLVSNFMKLHALTQAARSYVLLVKIYNYACHKGQKLMIKKFGGPH